MAENKTCDKYDPACLPDLLPIYYKRLFPYGPYYRWLHYGGVPKHYFNHREFSFTLKDDVYIRYQSFADQADMEREIQKRNPYKIDIGAVYSHRPKEHKTVKAAAFQAQEKELVFDIDMTDYDDVRACCSGADICENCWPLMTIAMKIIDVALRDDFGFDHILWVYSGRRGVHCWVCDESARKLSQNGRSAIAEYLTVVKGGESQIRKVILEDNKHPAVQRALDIVEKHFVEYAVQKQDFLSDEDKWKKILQLITDEKFKEIIEDDLANVGTNTSNRWKIIQRRVNEAYNVAEFKKYRHLGDEIMMQFCYPRLDVNVSKGINHLLKSPFCIHPKTGRVCIPIDIENVDSFNPFAVPTISQLLDELNQTEKVPEEETEKVPEEEEHGKKLKDYKKTSLKDCIQIFEQFVKKLENSWRGNLLEQSDIKKEF